MGLFNRRRKKPQEIRIVAVEVDRNPPAWESRGPRPSDYAEPEVDGIPGQLKLTPWNYGMGNNPGSEGYGFLHPCGKPWPANKCNSVTYKQLGIVVLPVAGVIYRQRDASRREFDPGKPVQLVPEPNNPHDPGAIAVRSADGRWHAGYIKATTTKRVRRITAAHPLRAIVLNAERESGKRVRMKIVLWQDGRIVNAPDLVPHAPVH